MLVQLFWLTDVIEFSSTVFEKLLFVNSSKYVFAPMALSRMRRIVFLLIISMSFRVGQLGGVICHSLGREIPLTQSGFCNFLL